MNLQPLRDKVVVKNDNSEGNTVTGGIIIPETSKDKPQVGTVVAVGTDEEVNKFVTIGDKVLYAKYVGTPYQSEYDDTKFLILSYNDILAIVKD